ncbi:restriction endonuclease [Rhodococcus sp. NPDC004095]
MEYITTAEAAEKNAALRMREMGFTDAKVTNAGSDGGIDVRSKRALAQVKWQGAQVGRPAVQQLYGARGSRHEVELFFFAATGYSQHAVQYADECEIKLFTFDPLGVTTPANRAARLFLQAKKREEADKRAAEERARKAEQDRRQQQKREADNARRQREAEERRAREVKAREESVKAETRISRERWIADKNAEIKAEFEAQERKSASAPQTETDQPKVASWPKGSDNPPLSIQLGAIFFVVVMIACGVLSFLFFGAGITGISQIGGDPSVIPPTIIAFLLSAAFFWVAKRSVKSVKKRGGF